MTINVKDEKVIYSPVPMIVVSKSFSTTLDQGRGLWLQAHARPIGIFIVYWSIYRGL